VSNILNSIPGFIVPTSATGSLTISGTPTTTGTMVFTVTETDSLNATVAVTTYVITVNAGVLLSPAVLPADSVGVPYNKTILASGGTGTVTLAVTNVVNTIPGTNLPTSGTGSIVLSGTPTAAGTMTFTVTATDSLNAVTVTNYSFAVNPAVTLNPSSGV